MSVESVALKVLRYFLDMLRKSNFVTKMLVEAQKKSHEKAVPFASFCSEDGYEFDLLVGYRDRIAPSWRLMANPSKPSEEEKTYTSSRFDSDMSSSLQSTLSAEKFLSIHNLTLKNKKILEVGCHNGGAAFILANKYTKDVTATDLSKYYIHQSKECILSEEAVKSQFLGLSKLREDFKDAYIAHGADAKSLESVKFIEDDILDSKLPSNSFDMVLSFEVLEHVSMPDKAFREIFRLLKPGGYAFHEYNPFFCENGGHSLCTLDFPFGHVRLSSNVFNAYVEKIRPDEAVVDYRFYTQNLNRMTLKDVESYSVEAGFDIVALVDIKTGDLDALDSAMLEQSKRNYPTLTINDLLADSVTLLLRKPL